MYSLGRMYPPGGCGINGQSRVDLINTRPHASARPDECSLAFKVSISVIYQHQGAGVDNLQGEFFDGQNYSIRCWKDGRTEVAFQIKLSKIIVSPNQNSHLPCEAEQEKKLTIFFGNHGLFLNPGYWSSLEEKELDDWMSLHVNADGSGYTFELHPSASDLAQMQAILDAEEQAALALEAAAAAAAKAEAEEAQAQAEAEAAKKAKEAQELTVAESVAKAIFDALALAEANLAAAAKATIAAVQAHTRAREDVEAEDAQRAETKAAAERFSHPLNPELKGFDPKRFNIAVVGTNNVGKSNVMNTLFSLDDNRRTTFIEMALDKVDGLPMEDEAMEKLKEQVQELENEFKSADGRCTSWDMIQSGESLKHFDIWLPGGDVFDLPGVELRDGGAEEYVRRASINYFDAVILVVEKALSMDDFTLLLHCQKAPNRPGGVPFFIVRSKTDLAVLSKFKKHIDEKLPRREFDLNWAKLVEENLSLLLDDLPKAHEEVGRGDVRQKMSGTTLCPPERVIFSGIIADLQCQRHRGCAFPTGAVEQLAKIFDRELHYLRTSLMRLARRKKDLLLAEGIDQAQVEHNTLCISTIMERSVLETGPGYDVPREEEIELEIDLGSDDVPIPGFELKKQASGPPEIVKPKKGEDLRQEYGIEDNDVLIELPIGHPVDRRDFDLPILLKKRKTPSIFKILVQRDIQEEARTLFSSHFKQLYSPSHRSVTDEEYKKCVEGIVKNHAKHFHISQKNQRKFLQALDWEKEKEGITDVEQKAVSDWTSGVAIDNSGRQGEVEFCSMVNATLRNDDFPAVTDVAVFMMAMRISLVQDLKGPQRLPGPEAAPREDPLPRDGILIRGSAMPGWLVFGDKDNEPFFFPGQTYRNPQFCASTDSEHKDTAEWFAWRAVRQNEALWCVRFEIDVSESPLHVNRIPNRLGEVEFLWAPYTCFEVVEVIKDTELILLGEEPIIIRLKAFRDNKACSEHWALAPWH